MQIAKNSGARVIATASARNLDYLRSLGADQVIDYTAQHFDDQVRNADIVITPWTPIMPTAASPYSGRAASWFP